MRVTARQREYLRAIDAVHAERPHTCPTFVEIADHMEVNYSSVACAVLRLKSHGLIAHETGVTRSLRLTDAGRAVIAEDEGDV